MLAKIKCTPNLGNSLSYNEEKVKQGKAECLLANNFIKESAFLSRQEKRKRFTHRASLHEKAACNSVQIILTFSPLDKLSDEKMSLLAQYYMESIGFEAQPYLVYRHLDTYHPHMHVRP